jgi:hypothetical protein
LRKPLEANMRDNKGIHGAVRGAFIATVVVPAVILLIALPAISETTLNVSDTPDDWGTGLTVSWRTPAHPVTIYELWRLGLETDTTPGPVTPPDTTSAAQFLEAAGWEVVSEPALTDTVYRDSGLEAGKYYSYVLLTTSGDVTTAAGPTLPRAPERQWLRHGEINILVAVLIFMGTVVMLVERARRGAKLFIRRIAGLEAVEEAVGRATEMGRPILYIPGLDPMDEVATVAAIDILGQVAKKAGEYETRLMVPNRDPIVMAVAQQVVRESYSSVGKPHLYRDENVFYVTYSQFGFAAAVAGLMIREKPATNFFIGHFYAESLVLAETGNATGAIQIAGTDSDAQLPFFISSCDYTLIGEELYAGAVYLSRQPLLLGALKAQDYAKAVIIAVIGLGILFYLISPGFAEKFAAFFK